ncbi:hypothetical protein BRC79_00125 [Halobacteriales archaeon QH_8_67_27]|nr:MAG: hypothetical protein BRC79_00125 [Halobacteriales archaeon QH_8_67_27]
MYMNLDRDTLQNAVEPETVESIGKIVPGVGALAFVVALASLLPGLDLPVPQTPVTLAAVVGALVTVAVDGLLLYLASGPAALTRLALDGPADVVEHVASVVHWLVVLATALVAHAGLAPAVQPLFGGVGWLYDVAFLLAALGPLVVVGAAVRRRRPARGAGRTGCHPRRRHRRLRDGHAGPGLDARGE